MERWNDIPLAEFDEDRRAVLEPGFFLPPMDLPRCCVITFFREVLEAKRAAGELEEITTLGSELVTLPVWRTQALGREVCLVQGFVGSAGAAGQLEELISLGCDRFVVCGGAGVLVPEVAVGHLIVPTSALRDEGASYHYAPPSREIAADPHAVAALVDGLTRRGIPHRTAKTWTTDGFYRETRAKVARRVAEGCVTVEMEAAAFFAVAQFRGVALGQLLYGGDDLSGPQWSDREWNSRAEIRANLVDLALELVLELHDSNPGTPAQPSTAQE